MGKQIQFGLSLLAFPRVDMTGEAYINTVQQGIAILSEHIDSLWFIDHLQQDETPLLEAWTALTYWAALQPRLQIGHVVLSQSFIELGVDHFEFSWWGPDRETALHNLELIASEVLPAIKR